MFVSFVVVTKQVEYIKGDSIESGNVVTGKRKNLRTKTRDATRYCERKRKRQVVSCCVRRTNGDFSLELGLVLKCSLSWTVLGREFSVLSGEKDRARGERLCSYPCIFASTQEKDSRKSGDMGSQTGWRMVKTLSIEGKRGDRYRQTPREQWMLWKRTCAQFSLVDFVGGTVLYRHVRKSAVHIGSRAK